MKEQKTNILLVTILVILMIIAIAIVIVNPNKNVKPIENIPKIEENIIHIEEDTNKINEKEEKRISMQEGGMFCKIGNQIVFYEEIDKGIYLYNVEENKTIKIATIENEMNKMYFDGENIYYIPSYYSSKGIYKIDLQGNIIQIYEDVSLQLILTENEIYFVKQIGYDDFNKNPQGTICCMDKNGNNIVDIVGNVKNNFFLENDKIYYTTQDRKMYAINKDGTNQVGLVQGRKFVIGVENKYLVYTDYANQEAKHIIDFESNEDKIIAYFGTLRKCQGKTYLNARKRLDDGSIEEDYTLFEITENGIIKEISKIANSDSDIRYISNEKIYIYNQQEGIYAINIETNQKENSENYKECKYFLGGYGYKIDDTNLENIQIGIIEL